MFSVSVITLFALVTVAPAELKVLPLRRADLDDTTLGMTSHLTKGVVMSPMGLRMPQGRPLASPNMEAGAPRVVAASAEPTKSFGWGKKWDGNTARKSVSGGRPRVVGKQTSVGKGPWTRERNAQGKWEDKFPEKGSWNSWFQGKGFSLKNLLDPPKKGAKQMAALYFPEKGFVAGFCVGSAFMLVASTFVLAKFRKRTSTIDGSAFQQLTA